MSRRRVTARSNGDDGSHSHTLDDGAKLDDPPHLSTSSPSASDSTSTDGIAEKSRMPYSKKSWIVFALASGACAAFNGVFAKLYVTLELEAPLSVISRTPLINCLNRTTTELTTSIAASIAKFLHLGPENHVVEYIVRAVRTLDIAPLVPRSISSAMLRNSTYFLYPTLHLPSIAASSVATSS